MKTIIFILFAWLVSFSTPVLADAFTEIQYEYHERSVYIKTPYTYKDKKGDIYMIYINKNNGRCCIKKEYIDKKGEVKTRNQYLCEEDSRDVARKMNIPYTYVKK